MQTKQIATLCAFVVVVPLIGQNALPRAAEVMAFSHVTVVDVAASDSVRAVRRDQTVIVSGVLISAVGPSDAVPIPPGTVIVDARGKFLIPGLRDMHTHLLAEDRLDSQPTLYIANGVTGVRVMGSALAAHRRSDLRTAFATGEMVAPRLDAITGRILENANGRPDPLFLPIATVDDARRAVASHRTDGADFVKVYNRLTREMYMTVIDEAKRRNIPVAGHIPMSMTALEVSNFGQRTIEHSGSTGSTPAELLMSCSTDEDMLRQEWRRGADAITAQTPRAFYEELYRRVEERAAATYDAKKCSTLFRSFVRNGTWHVPTLVVDTPTTVDVSANAATPHLNYIRSAVVANWPQAHEARMREGGLAGWRARVQRRHQLIAAMYAAGVRMMAGTDAMQPYIVPGFSLHDELSLLVAAGLTPLHALRTATLHPAQFLGISGSHGTVQRGKVADLVLLDANPVANITNTRQIVAVMKNGRYHPRQELDRLLTEVERTVKQ